MSQNATEAILAFVEQSRARAEKAERRFDMQSSNIERKAERSIDLFGGTAVSEAVDIAADARRACDDLYAAYQTEIRVLDEVCRPLLEEQPALEAVKAVYELIEWLNDESEIENNFSASLNSRELGQFAAVKYMPTMENNMIQRYWEAKYDSWPGRAEEKAREEQLRRERAQREQERRDAERARREEAERQKKEAEEKAAQAVGNRIQTVKEDLSRRIKDLKRELSAFEKQLMEEIDRNRSLVTAKTDEKAQLGLFKRKEKQALTAEITALQQQIQNSTAALQQKQEALRSEIDRLQYNKSLLSPKEKDEYVFGKKFHGFEGQPMTWLVAENTGKELVLIAKQTVEYVSYYAAYKWLREEFINKVFSEKEQSVLVEMEQHNNKGKAMLPNAADVKKCAKTVAVTPEDTLEKAIRLKVQTDGRLFGYNKLQIANLTESQLNDVRAYWLYTQDNGRSSFASYVSRDTTIGRIGAGARFGIRPMIRIDLEKLLNTL